MDALSISPFHWIITQEMRKVRATPPSVNWENILDCLGYGFVEYEESRDAGKRDERQSTVMTWSTLLCRRGTSRTRSLSITWPRIRSGIRTWWPQK